MMGRGGGGLALRCAKKEGRKSVKSGEEEEKENLVLGG